MPVLPPESESPPSNSFAAEGVDSWLPVAQYAVASAVECQHLRIRHLRRDVRVVVEAWVVADSGDIPIEVEVAAREVVSIAGMSLD